MKKLKSLSIAGKKFTVKYVEMKDCWGECDVDELTISLNKECLKNDVLYKETLMHECVHAVIALSGCRYSIFEGDVDKEEGLVRAIECLLFPVIDQILKG